MTNRTKYSIFTDHVRGTKADSVFTGVCHSVHGRGLGQVVHGGFDCVF